MMEEKIFNGYCTYPSTTPGCESIFDRYSSYVKNGNFLNISELPFIEDFTNYAFNNSRLTKKNLSLVNKDKNYKIATQRNDEFFLQWRSKYIFDFEFKFLPHKELLSMSPSEIVKKITKSLGLNEEPTIFLKPSLCGFGILLRISKSLWQTLINKGKALILKNRKGLPSRSWGTERCILFRGRLSIKFGDTLYFSMPCLRSYTERIKSNKMTFLSFNSKAPLLTKKIFKKIRSSQVQRVCNK